MPIAVGERSVPPHFLSWSRLSKNMDLTGFTEARDQLREEDTLLESLERVLVDAYRKKKFVVCQQSGAPEGGSKGVREQGLHCLGATSTPSMLVMAV